MAARLRIGKLRERVRFEAFTESDNAFGEPERSWNEHLTCWAEVLPVRVGESVAEGQELSSTEYTIRVRSSAASRAITNSMRATWEGITLDISPPRRVDGKNRYLEFIALARSSEQ